MRRGARGFTLIELVFVIVILGVLAAYAVPRLTALQADARLASLRGVQGGVRSAAALVRALSGAQNTDALAGGSAGAQVTAEGATITTAFGYPRSDNTAGGIVAALADTQGITITLDTATNPDTIVFQNGGAPAPVNCSFSYQEPAAAGAAPVLGPFVSSGC